jgi:hypothetical protein
VSVVQLKIAKPSTEAEKTTQTTLDTWSITAEQARSWKLPPFQRPLKVNAKVVQLSAQIALDGGVIPGVFCIGLLDGERWLVDGQHRREAFLLSECEVGYVDVRVVHFKSLSEMAEEFVNLNSRLVAMKADDIIRGLESSYEGIAKLRRACPFVGYDNIRRGPSAPVVSMSTVMRYWMGSAHDQPHAKSISAAQLAVDFSDEDVKSVSAFLNCCFTAWRKDEANHKLWGSLNLMVCAWLYRRLVMSAYGAKTKQLTPEQFTKCLMSLSADETYTSWLVGRQTSLRDIPACYSRVKQLFADRLKDDTGERRTLPQPGWATSSQGRK